jgi:hypothetical protein
MGRITLETIPIRSSVVIQRDLGAKYGGEN